MHEHTWASGCRAKHEHTWRAAVHLDGCHHYQNSYTCECGAVMSISGERQMLRRGKFADGVYMANDECARCRELMDGARRRRTMKYVAEKGEPFKRVKVHA